MARVNLHPWWYYVKTQESLWRVDVFISSKFDLKFGLKNIKLFYNNAFLINKDKIET